MKVLEKPQNLTGNPLKTPISPVLRAVSAVALAVGVVFAAQARTTVQGNVISWPDDGYWYEVQNIQTGETVCAGGLSCTVPDGIYDVAQYRPNGGSGTRVTVGTPSILSLTNETFRDTLSVNGYTLSFSVPGWYSVRRANTFEEICSGNESQCTVPSSGDYLVVNHSTNLRAEVRVDDQVIVTPPYQPQLTVDLGQGVSLTGHTLSWQGEGWFQLQSATDYSTICEGRSACDVEPGRYNLINLSTGWRYDNINVHPDETIISSPTNHGPHTGSAPDGLVVEGNRITWPDDGWYQVQSVDTYATHCEGGTSCTVEPGRYQVINLTTGFRFDVVTVTGGQQNDNQALINESNYVDVLSYVFDIYHGHEFGSDILALPNYSNEFYMNDRNGNWGVYLGGFGPATTEQCAVSGYSVLTPYTNGASEITNGFDFNLNQCNDGLTTYNGEFSRRTSQSRRRNNSDGITITSAADARFFSGEIFYLRASGRSGSPSRQYQLDNVSFESSALQTSLQADFYRMEVLGLNPRRINGTFTVNSPRTGGRNLSAWSDLENTKRADVRPYGNYDYFRTGTLRVSDGNGNDLVLSADNGDEATVNIELTIDGQTLNFIQPWSTWATQLVLPLDL